MPDLNTLRPAHQMAYLYLMLAHGSDDYLTSAELDVITERLCARRPDLSFEEVQDVVTEALDLYLSTEDPLRPARDAILNLRAHLTPGQRRAVLDDLLQIARADGLVLEDERTLLMQLATLWGIELPRDQMPQPLLLGTGASASWGVFHDLAYIYLVLAYGTDHTLSAPETRMMLTRLQDWQPDLGEQEARAILTAAMERYAQGPTEEQIMASVDAVRDGLPETQRQAALNDLVQIANADGVFLDDEEDLINYLTEAWSVSAYAEAGAPRAVK